MQNTVREYSKEDYCKLIEYLKLDYFAGTLYKRDVSRYPYQPKKTCVTLIGVA